MEKYGKSFKDLNKKEKIEYLWEYYRWPALVTVLVVIIAGSFINNLLKPRQINDVDVFIAGKLAMNGKVDDTITDFEQNLKTGLYITSMDWEMQGQFQMAMTQKIPMLLQTSELDVMVLPTKTYIEYLNQTDATIFMPLETVPELQTLLGKNELITSKDMTALDAEGNERPDEYHVYGIKISTFQNLPCVDETEEMVVGITREVKDVTKTANMINYLVP